MKYFILFTFRALTDNIIRQIYTSKIYTRGYIQCVLLIILQKREFHYINRVWTTLKYLVRFTFRTLIDNITRQIYASYICHARVFTVRIIKYVFCTLENELIKVFFFLNSYNNARVNRICSIWFHNSHNNRVG